MFTFNNRTLGESEQGMFTFINRTLGKSEQGMFTFINRTLGKSEQAMFTFINRTLGESEQGMFTFINRTLGKSDQAMFTFIVFFFFFRNASLGKVRVHPSTAEWRERNKNRSEHYFLLLTDPLDVKMKHSNTKTRGKMENR